MGTVNKVPGVSGGLVALVGGFYEEMIYTFQKSTQSLILFFRGLASLCQYTNFQFLLWLILGIVISYFSTALLLGLCPFRVDVWACFRDDSCLTLLHPSPNPKMVSIYLLCVSHWLAFGAPGKFFKSHS